MDRETNLRPLRLIQILTFLVLSGSAARTVRAQIDTGLNTTVWKMLYGVTDAQANDPAWLVRDDDGDGTSNGAELAAGTNPFSPASRLAVTATNASDSIVTLAVPTVSGKVYLLHSTNNLADPASWAAASPAVQVSGDGSTKTLTAARTSAATFYRVVAQDIDTDGDGVSDWAELAVGLDPTTAHTRGAALDDRATLAADLAGENVVTITATKASATQPPDAATAATDVGTITISRGGTLHFAALTVPLGWIGTAVVDSDYSAMPASVTFAPKVGSITLTLSPLPNPALRTSVAATVYAPAGGTYSLAPGGASASVIIAPAGVANGTGLTGYYYQNTSNVGTYSASLFSTANLKIKRLDPGINFTTWSSTVSPGTGLNTTYYTARWVGQVQPQYSETYYFSTKTDDGVKLWVNGQLLVDGWSYQSGERLAAINLQAGVLYDIKMEYFQGTGGASAVLSWYSNSQVKQAIPANRLYPDTAADAPPTIVSDATAIGFVGQAFSYTVAATATVGVPAAYAVADRGGTLPPGLALNSSTGVISGTPTRAGSYTVALTAANTYGTGAASLAIQILPAGTGVTRELFNGTSSTTLGDAVRGATPRSIDNALVTLEDNLTYSDNTIERLRGYLTVPTTGNYRFWLAANNVAELWIANDDEPATLTRRAVVAAPGTAVQSWSGNVAQPGQRSPWLALTAGQKYYYEVFHNVGAGATAQNVAVGWRLDATGQATTPVVTDGGGAAANNGVLGGYPLAAYDYPQAAVSDGSTLYVTNLSPQGTAASSATGSANLRVLPGNTQAILHFNYGGLSSPRTAYHVHIAPDATGSGPIVFDLDDVDKFHPELITADGGYVWNIVGVGTYSAPQIVTALQQGRLYYNVHTVNYPNGEIRGFLAAINGSQTPPVAVADPRYLDDSSTEAGAARFLNQAAFGASPADVAAVQANGYGAWINAQLGTPAAHLVPDVQNQIGLTASAFLTGAIVDNAWWREAVTGQDQLRQRVAFALSQILVVSDTNASIGSQPVALASYYDTLADNAFGNFRDVLKVTTLHPTMGYWLNMQGNQKGNLQSGYHPNENYAREIMQLFSVGLNRLWPDGSLMLDSHGDLIPTYDQSVITNGFARVFTGWTWHQATQANGQLPTGFNPSVNWTEPMTMVKNYHELGPKTLLDNVVLPPAVGYSMTAGATSGSQADIATAAYDSYCLGELEAALDSIFYHPNTGPYICRQLIQRLVASNPSPAYLQRVVSVFNDDATSAHVRGNLAAVVKAILLDGEARSFSLVQGSKSSGKQREPILRIAGPARTFLNPDNSGTYSETGGIGMTISTVNPHRFTAGDSVPLDFSVNTAASPGTNPSSGSYSVGTVVDARTFIVNAQSQVSANFTQAANSNTITVSTQGPQAGGKVYLKFATVTGGTETDGIYTVASYVSSSSFTVTTTGAAPTTAVSGTVILPRFNAYDTITNPTNATVSTITVASFTNHNVNVGDHLWMVWPAGKQLTDSEWTVASIVDERHFTVATTVKYTAETSIGTITAYPLSTPPLTRSGSVAIAGSKFDMGNTNGNIAQSPLNAPTVFNFFYPDYQFPGPLAAANVTTPEFQLTTDTNIMTLTNTVNSMVLSSGNVSGLSNFKSGSINLDLGRFMDAPYATVSTTSATSGTKVTATTTTSVNAPALVNRLNDLLTGGTMTQATRDAIVGYLNNATYFPPTQTATGTTTAPPPAPTLPTTSARDKARAAVQLILESPEYAVQK